MFDIGFLELTVVAVIALIVLGPERLPVAARTVGRWITKAKRAFNTVKDEVNRELQIDELRQQIKAQQEAMEKLVDKQGLEELTQSTREQIEASKQVFQNELNKPLGNSEPDAENTIHAPENSSEESSTVNPEKPVQPGKATETEDLDTMSGCANPVEFEPLPREEQTEKQSKASHD